MAAVVVVVGVIRIGCADDPRGKLRVEIKGLLIGPFPLFCHLFPWTRN